MKSTTLEATRSYFTRLASGSRSQDQIGINHQRDPRRYLSKDVLQHWYELTAAVNE